MYVTLSIINERKTIAKTYAIYMYIYYNLTRMTYKISVSY